jgi:hypothetical protein
MAAIAHARLKKAADRKKKSNMCDRENSALYIASARNSDAMNINATAEGLAFLSRPCHQEYIDGP